MLTRGKVLSSNLVDSKTFIIISFTPEVTGGLGLIFSDSNSPWLSGTLLSIQADPSNALVWPVKILPQIPGSLNLISNLFEIDPRPLIMTGITITYKCHTFF